MKGFGDQGVDLIRMEHLPPLGGDVAPDAEMLCRARGNLGRHGRGRRIGRVTTYGRRGRNREIGTHRAGLQDRE